MPVEMNRQVRSVVDIDAMLNVDQERSQTHLPPDRGSVECTRLAVDLTSG
jgi:hypothetical protein